MHKNLSRNNKCHWGYDMQKYDQVFPLPDNYMKVFMECALETAAERARAGVRENGEEKEHSYGPSTACF